MASKSVTESAMRARLSYRLSWGFNLMGRGAPHFGGRGGGGNPYLSWGVVRGGSGVHPIAREARLEQPLRRAQQRQAAPRAERRRLTAPRAVARSDRRGVLRSQGPGSSARDESGLFGRRSAPQSYFGCLSDGGDQLQVRDTADEGAIGGAVAALPLRRDRGEQLPQLRRLQRRKQHPPRQMPVQQRRVGLSGRGTELVGVHRRAQLRYPGAEQRPAVLFSTPEGGGRRGRAGVRGRRQPRGDQRPHPPPPPLPPPAG